MSNTINALNPKVDQTVRIFDSFYSYSETVPVNDYDIVYSFFQSIFADKLAAGNFTVSLFRISSSTQIPVLTLLSELEGKNQITITQTLAYYLNNLRSPATLLGFGSPVTPNYYTARNIKQ